MRRCTMLDYRDPRDHTPDHLFSNCTNMGHTLFSAPRPSTGKKFSKEKRFFETEN